MVINFTSPILYSFEHEIQIKSYDYHSNKGFLDEWVAWGYFWETSIWNPYCKIPLFNAYDSQYQKLRKLWLGELNSRERTFKLFRVTDESHTSNLSLHGEYITHQSRPIVRVKFKVYFTAFLGLGGLLFCIYAIWFLINKKGIVISEWVLLLLLLMAGGYYAFKTIRDLDACENAIESTLYRVYQAEKETEETDSEEHDDDPYH